VGLLAFDIETYGAWDALPERLRTYLTARDEARRIEPGDRRAAPNMVGLLPVVAQVVAVGLWSDAGESSALVLVPELDAPTQTAADRGVALTRFRDEADLLAAFWERAAAAVAEGTRLVTFNGRGFDGPMLSLRSAKLGVTPTVHLSGKRTSLRPHCDLDDVLAFFGARRERFGLEYWCAAFDVDSPKTEMNGREVAARYEAGEHDAIGRYAAADARATGLVFQTLAPSLLPLLEAAVDPGS